MKRSKIQLLQTTLLKILVEPALENGERIRSQTGPFVYDKVILETAKSCEHYSEFWEGSTPPVEGLAEKTYLVQLGLRTPQDARDVGPYRFEVVTSGVIAVLPDRKQGTVGDDDLAMQYGLTLLFGTVREQLSTITYKMPWGQVLLPTMTFLDEKYPLAEAVASSEIGKLET
jgi:hypothetical protein